MRILVTGGAGFIASTVVDEYIKLGHKVAIIDNLSTGKKVNINPKAEFFRMDIRDKIVGQVFAKFRPDVVNHHAAQKDVRISVADPVVDADINIMGALNLLENSLKHRVKQVIFASTGGAIYGEADRVPTPDDYPAHPISPYGVAKLTIENYLHYYHVIRGLPYVALRYSNVYGPRQDASGDAGVIAIFIKKLLAGEKASIFGSGSQTRDFVFVGDVVNANILALKLKECGSYNIGTGKEVSVSQLYQKIAQAVGSKMKPVKAAGKKGEQMRSSLLSQKATLVMGWEPVHDLDEGLRKTVEWYKKN